MVTTKILVNWKTKKIIHTNEHRGSTEFKGFLEKGYEDAGSIKSSIVGLDIGTVEVKAYWNAEYFDPEAKYPKPGK